MRSIFCTWSLRSLKWLHSDRNAPASSLLWISGVVIVVVDVSWFVVSGRWTVEASSCLACREVLSSYLFICSSLAFLPWRSFHSEYLHPYTCWAASSYPYASRNDVILWPPCSDVSSWSFSSCCFKIALSVRPSITNHCKWRSKMTMIHKEYRGWTGEENLLVWCMITTEHGSQCRILHSNLVEIRHPDVWFTSA